MKIRKNNEREKEVKSNIFGSSGDITFEHYFKKDEINANCRLCAKIIVPIGASIGLHEHKAEDEIYIVLKGQGKVSDGSTEYLVGPGDSILTLGNSSHSITNSGMEPLEFIAVIACYGDKK